MLNQAEVDAREEELRLAVRELPDEKRKAFYERAEQELKDPDTFAVLNYLFIAGLHHFYLGHWLRGLVNLGAFALGVYWIYLDQWMSALVVIGAVTLVELYALFRSEIIVKYYNNNASSEILSSLQE